MFRVIIAGGRDFDDYQLLKATMDKLLCNITDEITVVCGQAKGADTLGEQYAMEKGYAIDYYPAQWKLYGKRAGYLRNEQYAITQFRYLGTREFSPMQSYLFLMVLQKS